MIFTGCVSCTKVSEPLLGPNFTHLSVKKEVVHFFGTVDVSSSQLRFLKCLVELHKSCSELTSMPWIINTMGFTEGLGIHLMKKAVEMFKPTTIVQIESRYTLMKLSCDERSASTYSQPCCH